MERDLHKSLGGTKRCLLMRRVVPIPKLGALEVEHVCGFAFGINAQGTSNFFKLGPLSLECICWIDLCLHGKTLVTPLETFLHPSFLSYTYLLPTKCRNQKECFYVKSVREEIRRPRVDLLSEDGAPLAQVARGARPGEDGPGLVHRPGRLGHRLHRRQDIGLQQAQRDAIMEWRRTE